MENTFTDTIDGRKIHFFIFEKQIGGSLKTRD